MYTNLVVTDSRFLPTDTFEPIHGYRYGVSVGIFGVNMKMCVNCKEEKGFSGFHKDKKAKDKMRSRCKVCENERGRAYQKITRSNRSLTWSRNNREKRQAHYRLHTALKNGSLVKEPCRVCGSLASHAHHEDYSKPLSVWWLCSQHHKDRHAQLKEMEGGL